MNDQKVADTGIDEARQLRWFVERPSPSRAGHIQVDGFPTREEADTLAALWLNERPDLPPHVWERPQPPPESPSSSGIDEARAKLMEAIEIVLALAHLDVPEAIESRIDDLIAAVRADARALADPPVPTEQNLIPLLKAACALPTLEDALAYAAVWENDRAVKQARENRQWETCFRFTFHAVLKAWADARAQVSEERMGPIYTREFAHMTFNGGWHDNPEALKAFHHGMDTVFNLIDAHAVALPDPPRIDPKEQG